MRFPRATRPAFSQCSQVMPVAPGTTQVELVIGGMTCAACAARVQARLNKTDGVAATVNYATGRARVTAPARVSARELVSVVEAAGYSADVAVSVGLDAGTAEVAIDDATVRRLRRRLILALVFFVPLTDLSIVLSVFPWSRFPGWQWLMVALAAPVATWAAWPFHQAALKQAPAPVVLDGHAGVAGHPRRLRLVGLRDVLPGPQPHRPQRPPVAAAQLRRRYLPRGGRLGDDDTERWLPAGQLQAAQRFVVRPGERIAADGEVLSGQSAVDRSMMTGESVPVDAAAGDSVTGGTIVLTGRLVVRAVKVGQDTQLAHLIMMVEQAQAGKAGIQRLADRICAVFVPCVLACAAATLAGWLLAGSTAGHAFSAALAVLIIACPCALGLATPAALVVASGRGAQLGIFIQGYQALESSRRIDTVVLDKTGTVTTGQMTVTATQPVPGVNRTDLLRYAGSVEQASEHAVAAAVTTLARSESPSLPSADGFAGQAVRGRSRGQPARPRAQAGPAHRR